MAGYTIKNLREDVDDSAARFGMGDVLESHFARDDLDATQFGLSLQQLKPNARMPFGHQHETQEEVYVIVGGSGRSSSTTRSSTSAAGTRCAWRPRSCVRSRPGRTGWR